LISKYEFKRTARRRERSKREKYSSATHTEKGTKQEPAKEWLPGSLKKIYSI
jgi:hypothetical protein